MTLSTWLELTGFITGIAGIWLTMHRNLWCFPVGLVNVSISLWIFFQQQLYADALQQLMYIALLGYGWYHWKTMKSATLPDLVFRLTLKEKAVVLLTLLSITLLLGSLLSYFTNAHFPWPDSFATATAFVAQYLVARKKIENWILWMIVNTSYIIIYVYKGLLLYSFLFFIYLILSFYGYTAWKKELRPELKKTS